MALLFIDGFDHYGTSIAAFNLKWDTTEGGGAIGAPARTGAGALQKGATGRHAKILTVPGDVFILGVAVRLSVQPSGEVLHFLEGASTVHVALGFNGAGLLVVKRGTTTLATATTAPFALDTWYYVEIKIVVHDTTGSVAVHVDGVTVTFDAALTGIDTRNGGTGLVDRVALSGGGALTAPYTIFDDLYVCDDSGATNNDFLGICGVETLLPSTGNGTHTDWTPSTGTDHGALVDEAPPDDDTTYVTSLTVDHQDSYQYPALSLTGAILGVQTSLYVKKTDAGARTVAPLVRLTATAVGTAVSPLTTYAYFPAVRETNPESGVAWTEADVNALQAGVTIVT